MAAHLRPSERHKICRAYIGGELAARRVPEREAFAEPTLAPTFAEAAERWRASRVDVAAATTIQHRTALNRALPYIGAERLDELTSQDVAELIGGLHAAGKSRESIRKTRTAVAMVFDHERITPNPARDASVKLPREEPQEVQPPSAADVEMVYRLIPAKHRLALLWLDWSGARVASIDLTQLGDYDESRRRVRLRAATTKTRRALWVELPPELAEAIEATLPHRRFRDPEARLFADSGADALRTAITKAARRLGFRSLARTTFATGGFRCCTYAGCRGRESVNSSASAIWPSPPTPTRMF